MIFLSIFPWFWSIWHKSQDTILQGIVSSSNLNTIRKYQNPFSKTNESIDIY